MKLTKEQQQEIKDQQSLEQKTKRVTVPALEKILYNLKQTLVQLCLENRLIALRHVCVSLPHAGSTSVSSMNTLLCHRPSMNTLGGFRGRRDQVVVELQIVLSQRCLPHRLLHRPRYFRYLSHQR